MAFSDTLLGGSMAGRTSQDAGQGGEVRAGTVTTYTALMILLLAFFILLNSLGRVEEARLAAAFQSLKGAFGFQEGVIGPFGSVLMRPPEAAGSLNPVEADYLFLRGLAREQRLDQDLTFLRSGSFRTVVVGSGLLFAAGATELDQKGKDFLRRVAAVLAGSDYPLAIHGHTDDAPPPAGAPDNFALSAGRALSVLRHLTELGVSPSRLSAFGLAGYRPLVPNTSARNRGLNNRVELVMDGRDPGQHHLPVETGRRQFEFRGFTFDLNPDGR